MRTQKVIGLLMAAMMLVMAPAQSFAASDGNAADAEKNSGGKYISEVYTAYGKDEASAKNVLEKNGYTAVSGNLNEKGKTYVMMGYKTTNDSNKAIKDLALMNSRGGYTVGDYNNILSEEKKEIAGFLNKYMPAIKEYRANYKEGKAKAKIVHELLNNYVEEDSKMKMGDLLLADTLQDKVGVDASITSENKEKLPDLVTILMQGNTMVVNSIYELLAMAADSSDTNLIDRFAAKSYDDLLKDLEKEKPGLTEPKKVQVIKGRYGTDAKIMAEEAKEFAKALKEYEDNKLNLEKAKAKDVESELGEVKKVENAAELETAKAQTELVYTGLLYEMLKNYEGGNFKKGELLKFFMEGPKDDNDLEKFYPLAAALTKSQSALLGMIPISQLIMYAMVGDQGWAKQFKANKGKYANMKDISVYSGVDRNIYQVEGRVALTDEAKRKKAEVFPFDIGSKGIRNTLAITAGVGWVATLACVLAGAGKSINKIAVHPELGMTVEQISDKLEKVALFYGNGSEMINAKTFAELEKIHGSAVKAVENMKFLPEMKISSQVRERAMELAAAKDEAVNGQWIEKTVNSGFRYVTIALALISAGLTIAALVAEEKVDLPNVPAYMIDVKTGRDGKRSTLAYKAALSNGDDYKSGFIPSPYAADLKAYEGKQWLTIYTTKDYRAGKPILADVVVQNTKEFPGGYNSALHIIGEKGATNLINKNYMNWSRAKELLNRKSAVFMFYKHSTESETASAFSGGMIAIYTIGGVALIALIALLVRRSRKNTQTT